MASKNAPQPWTVLKGLSISQWSLLDSSLCYYNYTYRHGAQRLETSAHPLSRTRCPQPPPGEWLTPATRSAADHGPAPMP